MKLGLKIQILFIFMLMLSFGLKAQRINIRIFADTKVIYGDIDMNGKIEIQDLTLMSLYLLGDIKFNDQQLIRADVAYDNSVNIADLSCLKQFIMKDKIVLGPKS